MTSAVLHPVHATRPRPSERASTAALRTWMPPVSTLRPLALARGNVLRVRNGTGLVVHVRYGLVWITEHRSPRDVILVRGQGHAITQGGLCVVHADRDSRVVLEFRGTTANGACLEIARGYGEPGYSLGRPCSPLLADRAAAFVDRLRRVVQAIAGGFEIRAGWHRDAYTLQQEAHSPEAVRHRVLSAAGNQYPYY